MESQTVSVGPQFDSEALSARLLQRHPVLAEKVAVALDCSASDSKAAIREVIRFMWLVANSSEQLTPSHSVDLAWHEFILCTKAYQDFCDQHFGRMIHHFPGGPQDKHQRQFRNTRLRYTAAFGQPDVRFWGCGCDLHMGSDESDCGACESI